MFLLDEGRQSPAFTHWKHWRRLQLPFQTHHKDSGKGWQAAAVPHSAQPRVFGLLQVIPAGDKSLCSPRRDVPACQQQEMVDTAGCGCQRVRSAPRALSTTMLLAHLACKASTACLRVLTVGAGPPHSNKTSKSIRKCSHPTPGANQNLE